MSNPAVILHKIHDIQFGTRPVPELEDEYDVIVEVKKTGICASDIHYYEHGKIGEYVVDKPMCLGHEAAGTVTKIGSKVTSVQVGDNVAIEPGVPSRRSDEYKSGNYHLCPYMIFASTPARNGLPEAQGSLVRYYRSPEDFLVRLPSHVSLEMGALAEPLTVGVHGNTRAGTKFGDNVLVLGAGPVGLMNAIVARAFGATNVMIVDVVDDKLETAVKVGAATHTFNPKKGNHVDLIKAFGKEPDVILECTGVEPCVQLGIMASKPGGRFVQVGNCAKNISVPMTEMSMKEMTIFGSFRYSYNDYKTAVNILADNYKNGKENVRFDFESLITHRFKWEDAIKAYEFAASGQGFIKIMIDGPGPE